MNGARDKYEIGLVLAEFLQRGATYSELEIETLVRRRIEPAILAKSGYAPDHLRLALVENGVLERDSNTQRYWVSEEYQGFPGAAQPFWSQLLTCEQDHPDEKLRCPVCTKQAYPYILLKHYPKSHPGEYAGDLYLAKLIRAGIGELRRKYLRPD